MEEKVKKQIKKNDNKKKNCESCLYYDFDDETDSYICTVNLDEDEAVDFTNGMSTECHYYRYYDEYTSVKKQN